MRRFWFALLVGCSLALLLLAARTGSRLLVYGILNDVPGQVSTWWEGDPPRDRPETSFAEVDGDFTAATDRLDGSMTIAPLFPLVRILGFIDPTTILTSCLILALASLRWTPTRRPGPLPFNQLLERINRSCPSSGSRPPSAPMPKASIVWTPPAPR